jgi:hypothetical protein
MVCNCWVWKKKKPPFVDALLRCGGGYSEITPFAEQYARKK